MKAGAISPVLVLSLCLAADIRAASSDHPPSYEEARQAAWIMAQPLLDALGKVDATEWPGTHDWLDDLQKLTRGIDAKLPIDKWPKVDVGALLDHNPNFWRMIYETTPGDPILSVVHGSLLLSLGEPRRAYYVLELARHEPGIPKNVIEGIGPLENTALAALRSSNAATEEGTKRFDARDYDGAMKKYEEALKLCPQNGWTFYEMGYTLRTKAMIAKGESLPKPDTLEINGRDYNSAEVIELFAKARRADPMVFEAYQG